MPHLLLLAGGAGTRFWPASRASRPKQLLPIAGPTPLLRRAAERLLPLLGASPWERVLVSTGRRVEAPTRALLPEVAPSSFLVEPAARNTAPCIVWAAAHVARTDPDAVLVVVPSDQHVTDEPAYRAVVAEAIASASKGTITLVGIAPTRAETGYGYVEVGLPPASTPPHDGNPLPSAPPTPCALDVLAFREKPDAATAAAYARSGRHLWNAGMFVFRARDLLAATARALPALASGVERMVATGDVEGVFPTLPSISIDHGVMERTPGLRVVPGDFGWSDLGSFDTAWELADKDAQGNALPPGAVAIDAHRNLVFDHPSGEHPAVALLGVTDLVVVRTPDALLVTRRERSQDVRAVVDELARRGRGDLT